MAATVLIREKNATIETATDKTGGTVRFHSADSQVVDNNNRLVVPTAATEYSFEKWLRMHKSVAPSVDITDLEFFMDGAKGWQAGVKLWGATIAAFDGTNGPTKPSTANDPPFGPDDATGMTDAFTWTAGAPLSLGAGPFTAGGEPDDMGLYLVLVMEVEIASTAGTLATETATFRYTET